MDKLSIRQKKFVMEYMKDYNASQAAIRAGYSENTAASQGSRLLSKANISRVVKELQVEERDNAGIDREWVVNQYLELLKNCKENGFDGKGTVTDRGNWNKALQQLSKLLGLDEPEQVVLEVRNIVAKFGE